MRALLLAALAAGTAASGAPGAAPAADEVSRACDGALLDRARRAPATEARAIITEIDRHARTVLSAEQRLSTGAEAGTVAWGALAAPVILGVGLALLGWARRLRSALAVGLALLAGTALAGREIHERVRGEAARTEERLRIARCRLALSEARAAAMQGMAGACFHQLDEVEEDLAEVEARVGPTAPVIDSLRKIRKEVQQVTSSKH